MRTRTRTPSDFSHTQKLRATRQGERERRRGPHLFDDDVVDEQDLERVNDALFLLEELEALVVEADGLTAREPASGVVQSGSVHVAGLRRSRAARTRTEGGARGTHLAVP